VGKASPSALQEALGAGYGTPLAGALVGAGLANNASNAVAGAGIGGFLGGAGEMISGALVKNVTYSMITDLQILERTDEAVAQQTQSNLAQGTATQVTQSSQTTTNRHKFQTRVVSTANQVNLKFEEALPLLQAQLAKSIAGIL
jgi:predicted metalloprotease